MSRSLRYRIFGKVANLDDLAHEVSRGECKQVRLDLVTAGTLTDWASDIGRRPVLQLWARAETRKLKLADFVETPIINPLIARRIIDAGQYLVDRGIQVSVEQETFAEFARRNQIGVERR